MEEFFAMYPFEMGRFFRSAIKFGFWTGTLMAIPSLFVAYSTTDDGSFALRSMRAWVMVRLTLFFLQMPLRAHLYRALGRAIDTPHAHVAAANLIQLCQQSYWSFNQSLGMFYYFWFFLAGMFVAFLPTHRDTGLFRLMIAQCALCFVHMGVSWCLLQYIMRDDALRALASMPGASQDVIDTHTTTRECTEQDLTDLNTGAGSGCAVCYSDYALGENIRVLPCQHEFHAQCIDEWLKHKKTCPYCQHQIDQPFTGPKRRNPRPEVTAS